MKSLVAMGCAALVLAVQGCAGPGNINQLDARVNVSLDYTIRQKASAHWLALLRALDKCHEQGFQDASMAEGPKTVCEQQDPGGCTLFRDTASYDCSGMGYQSH